MLERLTVDDFMPAVGDVFVLDGGDAGAFELRLTEASLYDPQSAAIDGDGRRSPFRLVFTGPADPLLAQQTCRLEHPTVGALEIFIVPVRRTGEGTDYEAIFA